MKAVVFWHDIGQRSWGWDIYIYMYKDDGKGCLCWTISVAVERDVQYLPPKSHIYLTWISSSLHIGVSIHNLRWIVSIRWRKCRIFMKDTVWSVNVAHHESITPFIPFIWSIRAIGHRGHSRTVHIPRASRILDVIFFFYIIPKSKKKNMS